MAIFINDGKGKMKTTLAPKFGQYGGKKEIKTIEVDNELGYVYYSNEQTGVRNTTQTQKKVTNN